MAIQRLLLLLSAIGLGIGSFMPWRLIPLGSSIGAYYEFGALTAIFAVVVTSITLLCGPLDGPVVNRGHIGGIRFMSLLSSFVIMGVIFDSQVSDGRRTGFGPHAGAGVALGSAVVMLIATFMHATSWPQSESRPRPKTPEPVPTPEVPEPEPYPATHHALPVPVPPPPQARVQHPPDCPPPAGFVLNRSTVHLVPESWPVTCPSCGVSLTLYKSYLRINVRCGQCGQVFECLWP